MPPMIKKTDIALIIFMSIFAITFVFIFDFFESEGGMVIVNVEGNIYKELALDKDIIFEIISDGDITNTIEVKNGDVYMISADCPDGLCLRQGHIHYTNETIVCLPNKVVIEIKNEDDNEINKFDAIAQ